MNSTPVYQIQHSDSGSDVWVDCALSKFEWYKGLNAKTRILYPASAYEALKAENVKLENELDQYKEYYEEMSEHYRALQFIESEFRKENEAQASRIVGLQKNSRDFTELCKVNDEAIAGYIAKIKELEASLTECLKARNLLAISKNGDGK